MSSSSSSMLNSMYNSLNSSSDDGWTLHSKKSSRSRSSSPSTMGKPYPKDLKMGDIFATLSALNTEGNVVTTLCHDGTVSPTSSDTTSHSFSKIVKNQTKNVKNQKNITKTKPKIMSSLFYEEFSQYKHLLSTQNWAQLVITLADLPLLDDGALTVLSVFLIITTPLWWNHFILPGPIEATRERYIAFLQLVGPLYMSLTNKQLTDLDALFFDAIEEMKTTKSMVTAICNDEMESPKLSISFGRMYQFLLTHVQLSADDITAFLTAKEGCILYDFNVMSVISTVHDYCEKVCHHFEYPSLPSVTPSVSLSSNEDKPTLPTYSETTLSIGPNNIHKVSTSSFVVKVKPIDCHYPQLKHVPSTLTFAELLFTQVLCWPALYTQEFDEIHIVQMVNEKNIAGYGSYRETLENGKTIIKIWTPLLEALCTTLNDKNLPQMSHPFSNLTTIPVVYSLEKTNDAHWFQIINNQTLISTLIATTHQLFSQCGMLTSNSRLMFWSFNTGLKLESIQNLPYVKICPRKGVLVAEDIKFGVCVSLQPKFEIFNALPNQVVDCVKQDMTQYSLFQAFKMAKEGLPTVPKNVPYSQIKVPLVNGQLVWDEGIDKKFIMLCKIASKHVSLTSVNIKKLNDTNLAWQLYVAELHAKHTTMYISACYNYSQLMGSLACIKKSDELDISATGNATLVFCPLSIGEVKITINRKTNQIQNTTACMSKLNTNVLTMLQVENDFNLDTLLFLIMPTYTHKLVSYSQFIMIAAATKHIVLMNHADGNSNVDGIMGLLKNNKFSDADLISKWTTNLANKAQEILSIPEFASCIRVNGNKHSLSAWMRQCKQCQHYYSLVYSAEMRNCCCKVKDYQQPSSKENGSKSKVKIVDRRTFKKLSKNSL